jgi:hypothetical protein
VQSDQDSTGYKVWAVDGVVYGPVELPALVDWVKDERVVADTWIFEQHNDRWQKAASVPELKMFFRSKDSADSGTSTHVATSLSNIKPGSLRRVKILADLNDQQLERFAQFMEVKQIRQWQEVVKQGESGDAMYLVLEGELRVRMMIGGRESILTTLGAGEFFGEIALFDSGPRSADVISNKDSILLKVSVANFERLMAKAPELGTPFLYSIGKTLVARIRADNKRFKDSVNFARSAGQQA